MDAQLPLAFITLGSDRTQHPVLFGEGAYSKFTPDFYNTPAITDSAVVVGLRFKIFQATATIQYQSVGPNFLDGAPLRYFGPAPPTFQFWHGNYFPQFYGFANNLAINQTFDGAVTPGCAGTACSRNNANLTYIYPVFNPFVASGPQYFSAFAPNSQGFTANVTTPITLGDIKLQGRLLGQHLQELVPNGFGQIAYGPGFASQQKLKFDKLEGGLQFGVPLFGQKVALNMSGSLEHLARNDTTAYAYVPFNPGTGGPDPSSGAALNAYLAGGATPVLFFPNYVDEYHTTLDIGATVPLTRDLIFGAGYNTQTYHGSYGTTLGQNIAQRKDQYQGTLTYNIPKTTSSISALFRNQKYQDLVIPAYNFNQNREDLNFSIRFCWPRAFGPDGPSRPLRSTSMPWVREVPGHSRGRDPWCCGRSWCSPPSRWPAGSARYNWRPRRHTVTSRCGRRCRPHCMTARRTCCARSWAVRARAAAAIHSGDLAGAQRLVATLPAGPDTADLRGRIAQANGDLTSAITAYVEAGDVVRAQALIDALAASDPQAALRDQQRLVAALHDKPNAAEVAGEAWWRLGQLQAAAGYRDGASRWRYWHAAEASYEHALALGPNEETYLLAAGFQSLANGDLPAATRFYTHAAEVVPNSADAYAGSAWAAAAAGDCARARDQLARARALQARTTARAPDPTANPQVGAALKRCTT